VSVSVAVGGAGSGTLRLQIGTEAPLSATTQIPSQASVVELRVGVQQITDPSGPWRHFVDNLTCDRN
jgi:hypothetical protein